MTIVATSVLKNPTYAAPTGGTAKAFASLGGTVGAREVYFDGTLPLLRSEVAFSSKDEKIKADAPNGYTQPRRLAVLRVPLLLDNGKTTVNSLRIELAVDVETTAAEIDILRMYGLQILGQSSTAEFWQAGSTD